MWLESAAVTDIGICRAQNQDAYVAMPREGVFCVADGIGGGWKGERASAVTVSGVARAFEAEDEAAPEFEARVGRVAEALRAAGRDILAHSREHRQRAGGATAVAMVFDPGASARACILHAGDSRAYRFRGDELTVLTRDHTMLAEAGLEPDDDHASPFRNVITRAVGIAESLVLDETPVELADGDLYLLCSDGLSSMLTHREIGDTLREARGRSLASAVNLLVEKALWAGGLDNITAMLIQTDLGRGPRARLRRWWRRRGCGSSQDPVVRFGPGVDADAAV